MFEQFSQTKCSQIPLPRNIWGVVFKSFTLASHVYGHEGQRSRSCSGVPGPPGPSAKGDCAVLLCEVHKHKEAKINTRHGESADSGNGIAPRLSWMEIVAFCWSEYRGSPSPYCLSDPKGARDCNCVISTVGEITYFVRW